METQVNPVEKLFAGIENYSKTTYELSKLKLLETTANTVTALIPRLSVVIMLLLCLLVVSLGFAFYLGEILGKNYYGFFIIAAFYLVAGLILHFFLHGWIKKPVTDLIIRQALQ